MSISKERMAELLIRARAAKPVLAPASAPETTTIELPGTSTNETITAGIGRTGETITYNTEQQQFITLAGNAKSCVLIGAAGTGKTTCIRGAIQTLTQSGKAGLLVDTDHKYLPKSGTPGIVIIAYTRRAVNNIRRNMPAGMENNCITHHKLMEYEPEYYDVTDPVSGNVKSTMRFGPTRTQYRKLPSSIRTVIIEECSMYSVELFKELCEALPSLHNIQFIFLGDIQQLPPVFGSAILGYKMLELPTVELIQVYRQALESPIIKLAHRILSGKQIPLSEFSAWKVPDQLTIHPWKKKISADNALMTLAKFFTTAIASGAYSPEEDMILIPFNKSCGTDELNKHIANFIARHNDRTTYEVIAGFNKYYFSPGDKILYDKEDAVILSISRTETYFGKIPQMESKTMDYWGHDPNASAVETSIDDIDFLLAQAAGTEDDEEGRVRVASHKIIIKLQDTGKEIEITTASAINGMMLGYALTVHKAQGSEWNKVFLILHASHATMLQRELLYTAVTRAKRELYIICEPESFSTGIRSQRIKGNTLKEKAEYFKGKQDSKLA